MRRSLFTTSILVAAALFSQLPVNSEVTIPGAYSQRASDVGDFKQTNPRAQFAEGGKDFCAPTCLSDYLMWLGKNGYPSLLPAGANDEEVQIALIKKLASSDYMGTDPNSGTSPQQIMVGLKKYITDNGYVIKSLSYQGFRPASKEFFTGLSTPSLSWLKAGSIAPKCCWLNIGWYNWDEDSDTYTRTGGHWMALVGYGSNAKKQINPSTIIVHDPIPRFGPEKTNIYIDLQKLNSGTLTGNYKGLPRTADGFYWYESYTDGAKLREFKTYYGIIDGGIVLELAEPTSPRS
jgi:hypothetical protein